MNFNYMERYSNVILSGKVGLKCIYRNLLKNFKMYKQAQVKDHDDSHQILKMTFS